MPAGPTFRTVCGIGMSNVTNVAFRTAPPIGGPSCTISAEYQSLPAILPQTVTKLCPVMPVAPVLRTSTHTLLNFAADQKPLATAVMTLYTRGELIRKKNRQILRSQLPNATQFSGTCILTTARLSVCSTPGGKKSARITSVCLRI